MAIEIKSGMPRLSVEATLTLDEKSVAMLHHLCSYERGGPGGTISHIRAVCGSRFTDEEWTQLLDGLRNATKRVMVAAEDSRKNLFEER